MNNKEKINELQVKINELERISGNQEEMDKIFHNLYTDDSFEDEWNIVIDKHKFKDSFDYIISQLKDLL